MNEAPREEWTGLQRREGEILTQSGSAQTSVTAEGGGKNGAFEYRHEEVLHS